MSKKLITGLIVRTEKCPVVTLDKYAVDKKVTRVDYLKIDVEGYEYSVLVGCSELIDRCAPTIIQVELLEEFQERGGRTSDSILQLLASKGYHPHFFDQAKRRLLPFSIKSPRGNAFFVKNADSIHGGLSESRQE